MNDAKIKQAQKRIQQNQEMQARIDARKAQAARARVEPGRGEAGTRREVGAAGTPFIFRTVNQ